MKMAPRPKAPEMSQPVKEWLSDRNILFSSSRRWEVREEVVGIDAPPYVTRYIDDHNAWRAAVDEWAKGAPVDFDAARGVRGHVRFLGGPWLPYDTVQSVIVGEWDGESHSARVFNSVERAFEKMSEPEFKAFVASVYEHINAREAAHNALVKLLASVTKREA